MRNKLFYNREQRALLINWGSPLLIFGTAICTLLCSQAAHAGGDAPSWVHSLSSVTLPSYDEKTDAVQLYSETEVIVLSSDKIKTRVRNAYKILRPEGRTYGSVYVPFQANLEKITSLHGWSMPSQGKDFEVKEKDAIDLAPPGVEGGELIDDLKVRLLRIPAADPGNVVGYEYEIEQRPLLLQNVWHFQTPIPGREIHYAIQLPPGWEYKASWLNYPETKVVQTGPNRWEWTVTNVEGIRDEPEMPPFAGVTGQMVINFFAPGGPSATNGYASWKGMGDWYSNLVTDRLNASQMIKDQVRAITTGKTSTLQKMQAIAQFMQHDIRYVGIELGIGGWQPHPAADVFAHRYGDCKDKATLMRSMLREIGVESYYVVINTNRGAITPQTPAYTGFNHMVIAIKLPESVTDTSLIATSQHAQLGRLLFFDPTNELTPFGQIAGNLQANYGLLVTSDGGELLRLPQQPSAMNSIQRTGKLTLDSNGLLKGEVNETRFGDRAWLARQQLLSMSRNEDRVKPIEVLLSSSLSSFKLVRASILNLRRTDQPFGFNYSFEADRYAKNAGGLLLFRPRVLGVKQESFLETKEPRRFPVEFDGPVRDIDSFEITIPVGYEVDDLPPPVDTDYSFGSYHSKTELKGSVIRYTRTFEVKELSVPVGKTNDVRDFFRTIAGDERSSVVLKETAAK